MPALKDRRRHYPSDLSEAQWETIKGLIPCARRGGRKRSTDIRSVMNGVLYLVNTGCSWRYLPTEFPPWKTIYHYYRKWVLMGIWRKIHDQLRAMVRKTQDKNELATYLIIDSQSIRAAQGEERGVDGFKRVRGRKRHIIVDTMGLLHAIKVHPANLVDTSSGMSVVERLSSIQIKTIKVFHADQGYRGIFARAFKEKCKLEPLINARKNTGQGRRKKAHEKRHWKINRKLIKEPKRWVVERTFAWFNGYRRLSKDYEKLTANSEAMVFIAMTQLMLRRLEGVKSL